MGFEGYKIKHKLIVLKNQQDETGPVHSCAYNYEILFFISAPQKSLIRFDEIEGVIKRKLVPYSEKILTEVPPFDRIEPTLENIGSIFYQLLKDDIAEKKSSLERLEISDSPVRTFIMNTAIAENKILIRDKKVKVSRLILGDAISQAAADIISGFAEKEEPGPIPVEAAPAPVEEMEAPAVLPKPEKIVSVPLSVEPAKIHLYEITLSFICLLVCGVLVTLYLKDIGAYPLGSDTYGHLFKADMLYNSIRSGDLYPLYTPYWYNGMQPFRYWAPFTYYVLAGLEFIAGGNIITAYLYFVFFSVVVGGTGWLLWGITYHRLPLCTFIACAWFFLPDNLKVFFAEGNFPRMMITILLPYLFYFVWRFVAYRKKKAIIPVILLMCCVIMCHAMVSAMTGITTFILLSLYSIGQKRVTESLYVICAMLLSFALCGIWFLPALQGGILGMDATATAAGMQFLSTPFTISLNPELRMSSYYFGLSVIIISVIGLFLANKKSRPGFYTTIIVFLGTTTAMVPFLQKLPLHQVFWMTRFTPIVYAAFLLSLIEWNKSKRYFTIFLVLIILADCIPSAAFLRNYTQTPARISESLATTKAITKQRVSLMDLSAFDAYPAYVFSAKDPKLQYTFGWAWQGAATSHNIMMINTAVEQGYYYYLFDRSLELGDDTVLVKKDLVVKAKKKLEALLRDAEASGYKLYQETNTTYIFHRNLPKAFGVSTKYSGLSIGTSANLITLEYPAFEEGLNANLSKYTYKELSRYRIIYLSGFTYDDRKEAEALLTRVANAGTKVIVDMNRIPVDPMTNRMIFFNAAAQPISFSTQYPQLIYGDKVYDAVPFDKDYSTWNTVYLENLKQIKGYSWVNSKKLPFLGTNGNPNIVLLGYNILFHAMETDDSSVIALMNDLLEFGPQELPYRKIVPLTIKYQKDKIIIDSPGGKVNTTIAYQDIFHSKQKVENRNNLLTVKERHTEINLVYPYLIQGILLTLLGIFGILALMRVIKGKRGVKIEK